MSEEYVTVKDIQQKYNISAQTAMKYVKDLPEGLAKKVTVNHYQIYHIHPKALDVIDEQFVHLPEGAVPVSQLMAEFGTASPQFYSFLHRSGYYDKAIKIGKKNKRYYRIYFERDVADEIRKLYYADRCQKELNAYKPLTDFIDEQYIDDNLISFLKERMVCEFIDGTWHVDKKARMSEVLVDYMASLGFMPVADMQIHMDISRQRTHQIVSRHKDDESIYVKLRHDNSHSAFINTDFVKSYNTKEADVSPPEGYASISKISHKYGIPYKRVANLIGDEPSIRYKSVSFYDVNSLDSILAEESRKVAFLKSQRVTKPRATAVRIPEEEWLSLSSMAKLLRLSNRELLNKIDSQELFKEYVKTRNGDPLGKHLIINRRIFERLDWLNS